MNRRDATFMAHLDAIEGRIHSRLDALGTELRAEFRLLHEAIAGLKLELATHRHEEDT